MDFEVRHVDGTTVKLISSEHKCAITSATQTRKLCGNDTVTINLQSATYIDFYVGDKITIFGTTYTLNQLPTVKKESERSYSYTLVFEGLQYTLIDRVFLMPDNTQGDNLMFDLAGMLRELATNINRGNSGKQYEFVLDNSLEETEYKNLSLTGKNCLQVLQQLCQEWDTEFVFAEEPNRIAIYIGVAGSTFPTTFKYGRGGGVYELNREKGASDICTRLFVYGGTQNLTYYRHNRLCLPSKEKNQSYVEDATAQAVYGIKEQVKNFDDIYPNRIGTITSLSGCDYNEFIDSAMADAQFGFDLNEKWANNADDCEEWLALKGLEDTPENEAIYYNDVAGTATKYLMAGATAKIHFNTGALAGYECDLHSYTHSSQKFVLKPLVDENGYDFPSKTNAAFKLAVGDEYVILDINLPTAYKTQAESKLATEAASYFDTVCRPQPKYTLTIEPIALKHLVGPSTADTEIFKVGDLINISDPTGGVESATIRIDQFVRNLLDPFDYKLTLTDEITYSQQVRTLIEVDAIKRVVEESKIYDVNRIRRGWKDAEELYNQMFDTEGHYYSEKIAPLSIDTQMLKVGARSQQLVLQNVLFQPNYNANPANLQISAGSLVHYTIAEPDIKTWTMSALSASNVPSTAQYVYAKCAKNGTTGTWLVTDQAIIFDSDPSYYHFLVGSLSSVDSVSNTRNFAATYGFTTINGRNITTGVIKSSDGSSVVIDLDAGIIKGNITFESGTTSYNALQGIISGNTTVQTAATTANTANATANRAEGKIDGLEIGGRNLMAVSKAVINNNFGLTITKLPDGWFHIEGTITGTAAGLPRPLWGEYTEANTIAKNGIYTLSIETRGTMPISDKYKVQIYSYTSGGTSNGSTQYITTPNGKLTIDLTGRWLLRVVMYKTADATGTEVNGDIRFKLEKGNKVTDWTPAPEDVNAEIAAEAAAQTAALTNLEARMASDIEALQEQIDGQIMSWFYGYAPTMQNEPASIWVQEGSENDHLGDLFYDTTTGYAYRFINSGTESAPQYEWLQIADSDLSEALELARTAQATADSKIRLFSVQPTPPYDRGDMWVQGANGDIKYCSTARASGAFVASDWVIASKYTDDTAAIAAQQTADAAQTTANNAETHAQSALADLADYATDEKISPSEKQALVQQLSDINAEYTEIVKQATLYSLLTDSKYTAYATAYTNAKTSLEYYTETTTWANHITIITGNVQYSYAYIEAYYGKRQAILDKIAEVAQAYADNAALTAVSNLQIGGRNLLLNSSFTKDTKKWVIAGGTNSFVTEDGRKCYKIEGEKTKTKTFSQSIVEAIKNDTPTAQHYIMTGFCKLSNYSAGTTNPFVCPCYFAGYYDNNGTSTWFGANYHKFWIDGVDQNITNSSSSIHSKIVSKNNTGWFYFVLEFSLSHTPTSFTNSNYMRDCTGSFFVYNLKIEKGNKATEWTPAPEDTEAELTALQTDLQGQIDSKIETWSQSADPSTAWTTTALKDKHEGDLWQYTGSTTSTRTHNATYRWSGSAWVEQQASQELFNKIAGKAAIFYNSTASDYTPTGVQDGDFLLLNDGSGKSYRWKVEQGVGSWVPIQDYQTPIATLNNTLSARINNITDNGIISGGKEKYQIKGEWLEIAGSNGAGTTDGSYYTIKQKASPISGSTQSLDTAFSALKAKMDIILTSMSTDTTLDDLSLDADSFNALWKAYYDAETALENTIQSFYDDRIRRNLQASCATAEGTQAKVITCAEWKDGFFTDGTKLLVRFDNANTNQHPLISVNGKLGFIRYNNTLSGYRFPEYDDTTAPMWLGESVIQLEYAGTGHAEWTDGQGQTQRYPANGDYHIWQMPDEGAFKSSQVLQRSIKGQTDIVGGLILTETIALRNAQGAETAGMTGITEANDVAIYAGGDLRSAQNGTASVIIKKTGDAKFGAVKINGSGNGEMIMDSDGVRRLSIKNEVLKLEEQGVTYNADNSRNDNSPTPGTALSGGSVTTAEKTHNIFAYGMIQSPAHQYVFDVLLTISKVTIAVATAGGAGYITAVLEFYNGTDWTYVDSWELYNGQVRTSEKSDLSYLMRYANPTGYAYMGLRLRYQTSASEAGTATVSLSAPKWYYYCDQNKANMQIANDGMCYYLNSANQFVVKTNNDQSLTIKARGEIDIPGVLWAGEVKQSGTFTAQFNNSAVTVSSNGTTPSDTSLYNFKYTGISGTPIIIATPRVAADGYGWTAMVESLSTTNKTFSVRVKRDNAKYAADFHLVIFGTT